MARGSYHEVGGLRNTLRKRCACIATPRTSIPVLSTGCIVQATSDHHKQGRVTAGTLGRGSSTSKGQLVSDLSSDQGVGAGIGQLVPTVSNMETLLDIA
jgi:hypothetical protein